MCLKLPNLIPQKAESSIISIFKKSLLSVRKQPVSGYQEILAHLTSSIRFSLRNLRPLCIGRGNTYMAVVRRIAWPEDSSIHRVDCQRSACSNTPRKGEGAGNPIANGVVWPTW